MVFQGKYSAGSPKDVIREISSDPWFSNLTKCKHVALPCIASSEGAAALQEMNDPNQDLLVNTHV